MKLNLLNWSFLQTTIILINIIFPLYMSIQTTSQRDCIALSSQSTYSPNTNVWAESIIVVYRGKGVHFHGWPLGQWPCQSCFIISLCKVPPKVGRIQPNRYIFTPNFLSLYTSFIHYTYSKESLYKRCIVGFSLVYFAWKLADTPELLELMMIINMYIYILQFLVFNYT